ncbi:hypothetical protein CEXT_328941, partial [Caerostris extrusa]
EEKHNLDLFVLGEDKKSEAFQVAAIYYLKLNSESLYRKEEIGLHGHSYWEKPIWLSRKWSMACRQRIQRISSFGWNPRNFSP